MALSSSKYRLLLVGRKPIMFNNNILGEYLTFVYYYWEENNELWENINARWEKIIL